MAIMVNHTLSICESLFLALNRFYLLSLVGFFHALLLGLWADRLFVPYMDSSHGFVHRFLSSVMSVIRRRNKHAAGSHGICCPGSTCSIQGLPYPRAPRN